MSETSVTIADAGTALEGLLSWFPRRGIRHLHAVATENAEIRTAAYQGQAARGWLDDLGRTAPGARAIALARRFYKVWPPHAARAWLGVIDIVERWAETDLRARELAAIRIALRKRMANSPQRSSELIERALIEAAVAGVRDRDWSTTAVALTQLPLIPSLRSQTQILASFSLPTLVKVRRLIDHYTRQRANREQIGTRIAIDKLEHKADPASGPAEIAERGESVRLVADAISSLARPQQAVIRAIMEGLHYSAIAEALGVSRSTISRLHRAGLQELAKRLSP
jgi:RNA polymerase sigma factor (sigma-70 family)